MICVRSHLRIETPNMNKGSNCVFFEFEGLSCIEDVLTYARYDKFPVSLGHCLIIPKRHVETWFDMTQEEKDSKKSSN